MFLKEKGDLSFFPTNIRLYGIEYFSILSASVCKYNLTYAYN